MKRFLHRAIAVLLLATVADLPAQQANPLPNPRWDLQEHAYLGELAEIRKALGETKNLDTLRKNYEMDGVELIKSALEGKAYDVIPLLAEYGYPGDQHSFAELIDSLTPDDLSVLARLVPNFKEKWAQRFLNQAVQSEDASLIESLIKLGADLRPFAQTNTNKLRLVETRNFAYLKLLLQNGLDPYQKQFTEFPGGSIIDFALALKSADLVEALDIKKQYAKEVQNLRASYTPSVDSPYSGIWTNSADGFDTITLVLFRDGTGRIAGGMVSADIIWKQTVSGVYLESVPHILTVAPDLKLSLDLESKNGNLMMPKNDHGVLSKTDRAPYSSSSVIKRLQPIYVRLQRAVVDQKGVFWLQFDNRHISVPLSQLAAAGVSQKQPSPVAENVLTWNHFEPGPIPASVLDDQQSNVAVEKIYADVGYSPGWDQLYFDEKKPATLAKGSAYSIFESGQAIYGRNKNNRLPIYIYSYYILAAKPFSNNRNWLVFYFQPIEE